MKTKKDTYAPFVKMMLAKDKNLKTHFVPKGLSTSLSKKDLERFYDLMQTTFNLMDMAVENKFLSNLNILM